MRALIGVTMEKFSTLEAAFALALADEKERAYQEGLATGKRKRKPGSGQKGKLLTIYDKLVFLLYYLKVYPTFDVLGAQTVYLLDITEYFLSPPTDGDKDPPADGCGGDVLFIR